MRHGVCLRTTTGHGGAFARVLSLCMCALPPTEIAVVIVRPGDDASLVGGLKASLAKADMPLVVAASDDRGEAASTIIARSTLSRSPVRAIFELSLCSTTSMDLLDYCSDTAADLYRWQPAVGMFRQMCGHSGPTWLAAGDAGGVSEDIVTEANGWGYLSGDEERVVDTASMSEEELARLLGVEMMRPSPQGGAAMGDEGGRQQQPRISAMGYALQGDGSGEGPGEGWEVRGSASSSAPAVVLTELARRVLLSGATEPPGSYTLANGQPFPPEAVRGTFVSPLTGAPLFTSAQRLRSTTGWPSFAAAAAAAAAPDLLGEGPSQHLASRLDIRAGAPREECIEGASGAHLGHNFDGTLCINAASLLFVPSETYAQEGGSSAAGGEPGGEPEPAGVLTSLPPPRAPAIAALLSERPSMLGAARVATLGAGCFWGVRPALAALPGVMHAVAGFTGGRVPRPSYEQVVGGATGHVEAVQVAYDPSVLSYEALLAAYWPLVPDVTSAYRQGADVGAWYAPAIFFHSDAQRDAALASRAKLERRLSDEAGRRVEVVTRVEPADEFWVAALEHQR